MPKIIPNEFKESRFFKANSRNEIKCSEKVSNEIYFDVEVDQDGNETLLVCYPRNYSTKPGIERISYDFLMEKFENQPTVEKLISQFINVIIFGIGGTFIQEEMPKKFCPKTYTPVIPLRDKIESLVGKPQLGLALSTQCRNDKQIPILVRKIFSFGKDQSSRYKLADIFKGVQNNTEAIDVERVINHFKEYEKIKILGVRNVLIVNNSKLDIPNPLLSHCIVIPDAENEFLKKIDDFIKAGTIDLKATLNLHLSGREEKNHSDETWLHSPEQEQEEKQLQSNLNLHYSSEEEEKKDEFPTPTKPNYSNAKLVGDEFDKRENKRRKIEKQEWLHEPISYQRLSDQWRSPNK